jgi:hypothetical protein
LTGSAPWCCPISLVAVVYTSRSDDDWISPQSCRRPTHQLLVWMVLSVFMTLIAYIYLRNQLRPIKRLAAASAEYGRGHVVTYHPARRKRGRAGTRSGHAQPDRTPKPARWCCRVSAMICARR